MTAKGDTTTPLKVIETCVVKKIGYTPPRVIVVVRIVVML
jgi:hypothetical protein